MSSDLKAPDFDFICELVRREAAIVLEPGKEYLAENRLHPVARKLGFGSVGDLVDKVRTGNRELTVQVVDALTTNETSFFRDIHPWDSLRDVLLPELFERRRNTRSLNIWFAAASSGQEPYTMALLLKEHFAAELDSYTVRMVGTDISPTMLERCRHGRYSQLEVNRGLPAPLLVKYFHREGLGFVLDESVRRMVEFEQLNLADGRAWGRLPRFDLVFCRNVLIYFDLDTKRAILENIRRQIADDGSLFLGASETTINLSTSFIHTQVGSSTCYVPA